jgi:non-ribosomal peptide synthetase component F
MNESFASDLKRHLQLCEEILALLARENQSLRDPAQPSQFEACQARKAILPQLEESVRALRSHRDAWRALSPEEKKRHAGISQLLRQTQETIMKALALDRENEQSLLRRGLIPARHIPPASRQQPHFVADLYRRNGLAST